MRVPAGSDGGVFRTAHSATLTKPEFSYEHRFNSLGLRDVEPVTRHDDEVLIIGLGDSFTEGVGAAEDSTWLKQLERQLNSREQPRALRTINGGRNGSDPFFAYQVLVQKLLVYRPSIVIVAVNRSDLYDIQIRGGSERFLPGGGLAYQAGPSWEWLYGTSFTVRLVVHRLLGYNWRLVKQRDQLDVDVRSSRLLFSALQDFARLAEDYGFEFVVVLHPGYPELRRGSNDLMPLLRLLRDHGGIRVADLCEYYRGPNGIAPDRIMDYFWRIDRHHNERGYGLFASGAAEALERWGLVP